MALGLAPGKCCCAKCVLVNDTAWTLPKQTSTAGLTANQRAFIDPSSVFDLTNADIRTSTTSARAFYFKKYSSTPDGGLDYNRAYTSGKLRGDTADIVFIPGATSPYTYSTDGVYLKIGNASGVGAKIGWLDISGSSICEIDLPASLGVSKDTWITFEVIVSDEFSDWADTWLKINGTLIPHMTDKLRYYTPHADELLGFKTGAQANDVRWDDIIYQTRGESGDGSVDAKNCPEPTPEGDCCDVFPNNEELIVDLGAGGLVDSLVGICDELAGTFSLGRVGSYTLCDVKAGNTETYVYNFPGTYNCPTNPEGETKTLKFRLRAILQSVGFGTCCGFTVSLYLQWAVSPFYFAGGGSDDSATCGYVQWGPDYTFYPAIDPIGPYPLTKSIESYTVYASGGSCCGNYFENTVRLCTGNLPSTVHVSFSEPVPEFATFRPDDEPAFFRPDDEPAELR